MEEVIKFLTENPQQYLATTGLDGNAKVRPMSRKKKSQKRKSSKYFSKLILKKIIEV